MVVWGVLRPYKDTSRIRGMCIVRGSGFGEEDQKTVTKNPGSKK